MLQIGRNFRGSLSRGTPFVTAKWTKSCGLTGRQIAKARRVLVCSTTGRPSNLTVEERTGGSKGCAAGNRPAIPVVAATGHNRWQTLELTKR
jgi:hypothetical protein